MNEGLPENLKERVLPLYLKIILLVLAVVILFEGFLLLGFQKGDLSFTLKENKYGLKLDQKVAVKLTNQLTFGQKHNNKFFVWDTKTWHEDVKNVEIEFVDTPQPYGVVINSPDPGKTLSSFNNGYNNKKLLLKIQVADSVVGQDISDLKNIYTDAIMRALFFSKSPDFIQDSTSQEKVNTAVLNQIESGQPLLLLSNTNPINNTINQIEDLISFLKPGSFAVKAAGCYGTYECGTSRSTTTKTCMRDGDVISGSCATKVCGASCGIGGTCVCNTIYWCDGTESGPQPCGGDASSCTGLRCSTSGSCTYSNACTWDSSNPTCSQCGTYPSCYNVYCDSNKCAYGCSSSTCDGGVCNSPPATTPPTPVPTTPPVNNPLGYHDSSACDFSYGWACDADNYSQPLDIHFYADGPYGTGTYIGFTTANVLAEAGVAAACGGNAYHRFNFVTPESLKDGNLHTIYAYAINIGSGTNVLLNQTPKSITCSVPVANCRNLSGTTSMYVGETGTFTATYENGTGPVTTEGLAIYQEGQCEPNTPAYWTQIFEAAGSKSFNWVPSAAGTYDVVCRAWNDGISECRGRCYFGTPPIYQCAGPNTTMKVTVLAPMLAWWQVKDADILANGDVRSAVPASSYFNLVGSGGFPGVVTYSGTTNLTSTNVSTTKWLAKTAYSSNKVYGSGYFVNSIPSGATINNVSATTVPGSYFETGGAAYNGYYWYVYDGAANGGINLTISSPASLGSRKVILIVKNASLNISGGISLTKGSGFFLGVTSGNINISTSVGGGGSANLQGIFIADGVFNTGTGGTKTDSQLWIRGTVAGYGGVNLQRDLGNTNNSTTPAEFFEYAPDLELLFPVDLASQVTNWREIAP